MTLRSHIVRREYTSTTDDKTRRVISEVEKITPARVIRRERDGLSILAPLDGSCPTRSTSMQAEAIGEVVTVPSGNFQQIGSTGLGSNAVTFGGAWLERQEPVLMERDETTFVTYHGGGFTSLLVIEYLLPRKFWVDSGVPELHPDISIANFVVVDSVSATADVTVGAAALWDVDPVSGESILGPVRFSFKG